MLDTNMCIYIRRKRPKEVLQRFSALNPGEAAISIVTYGELVYGVKKVSTGQDAMRALDELVTIIPVLEMSDAVGEGYGIIRADLAKRSEMIGNNDLWIAAHAKALGMIVVTNNEREFRRIAGLKIENWTNE